MRPERRWPCFSARVRVCGETCARPCLNGPLETDARGAYWTVTVACMLGWIVQWYAIVPAVSNVWLKV